MKSRELLTAGASVLALTGIFLVGTGASADPVYRPHGRGIAPIDPNLAVPNIGTDTGQYVAPKNSGSGTWADVANLPFLHGPWNARMQTDGTVLISDYLTKKGQWYKLTPDSKGRYEDGTWSKIAPMPSGYSPLFFASQTLPDGRMIVNGGEYNIDGGGFVTLGALYDPVKNSWTSVSPPGGWSTIGDAESVILPNGTYMLADCCDFGPSQAALASVSGTNVKWTTQNTYYYNDEETFTPLPDGDLQMVDVWNHGANYDDYETYDTSTGTWSLTGQTADYLSTSSAYELGPSVVRPDGTILQFSANPTIAVNDIYDIKTGKWSSGPTLMVGGTKYDCADAPAVELPSGNTLVEASPGIFAKPSAFFEIGLTDKKGKIKVTRVNEPREGKHTSSFEGTFVMLPTGQALWDNSQVKNFEVATYTPVGSPRASWLPVVSSVSSKLTVGSTGNAISGTNFNGFSLGASYGDDAQMSTNYPLVRITNNSTGDVCFARSYNFSTMGIWTSGTTSAEFDIPKSCETGASTLQAIVNGIASTGTAVTLS
ncbi:MAG TPA: hypothetical protein VKR31_08485 [Rhizomicrobium sp.]|nr:hypothetical protein [Rhizomicrobium sp.]